MMREQNPKPNRLIFYVVARRPSQAKTQIPNTNSQEASKASHASWWKRMERLGLILGVSGISITSLIAGIGEIQRKLQAVETMQENLEQHEKRLNDLEKKNHEQSNQLNYIEGKIEQPRPLRQSPTPSEIILSSEKPLSNEFQAPRPKPQTTNTNEQQSPEPTPQTQDTRAPLHVIDKLNMTITYAYRKALRANPNLAGRLWVKCIMDEEGNLSNSEVIALDREIEEVAANVRDKVQRWHFPNTVTGLEEGEYQKTYFLTPSSF